MVYFHLSINYSGDHGSQSKSYIGYKNRSELFDMIENTEVEYVKVIKATCILSLIKV